MSTLVHNLNGTGNRHPSDGSTSWKDWWEKRTGRKFSYCSCVGCSSKAEVGAHVQKVNGGDEWYIVPLCNSCNVSKKNVSFKVDSDDLVPLHP